jgi:MFS transporter, YNFM family, putative membrane transport protein
MLTDRRRLAVMLAGAAAFVDLYAPQSILPQIAAAFGIGEHQAGLVITVTTLAVALIAPFAGALSDALGRKRVIVAATSALTVPTLLAAMAHSFPLLLFFRVLSGVLMPLIFCVTVAYISEEWQTKEARAVTALYMAGAVAGGFAGRFLTGVVTEFTDWRVAFVLLAALNLAMGLTLLRWMPRECRFRRPGKLASSLVAMRAHIRSRRFVAACVVGFAILFAQVGLFTYANFLLAGPPFYLGPGLLGSIFAVYLVGMLTTPVAGSLMRRFPEQVPLSLGASMFVGGVALTLIPSLAVIVAGLALASAGTFLSQSAATNFVAQQATGSRSAAVGLYTTWYYIGGSAGAVVPGALWYAYGWAGVVALLTAANLAAALIALACWPAPTPAPSRGVVEKQLAMVGTGAAA